MVTQFGHYRNVLLILIYPNLFYSFWVCHTCHALAIVSKPPQVSRCYIPLIARSAASVDDFILESSFILCQSRNDWRTIGVAEVLEVRVAENQDLTHQTDPNRSKQYKHYEHSTNSTKLALRLMLTSADLVFRFQDFCAMDNLQKL